MTEEKVSQSLPLLKKVSWDDYFMTLVYLVATRSKDRFTHIGAVVVGPDKEIRATGYNSFPRLINDAVESRQFRPEKYYWFAHAEMNAITNAALIGVSLKNCVLYTNGVPCATCGRAVINAGIKEVVVDEGWEKHTSNKWYQEKLRTEKMFEEAGVRLRVWAGEFVKVERYKHK